MRYLDKSFSLGYVPPVPPEPPCPLCPLPAGLDPNRVRKWKLCKRHREELLT